MRKPQRGLLAGLLALAMIAAVCFVGQNALAQDSSRPDPNVTQPPMPSDSQSPAVAEFTGKIVKSGGKLVLSDDTNKTMYQLNDQKKAKEYLNRNVKVSGVLDASTGTIRVSAIEPI